MGELRGRKIALLIAIAVTSVLPLAFLRLDEPRFDLNVYKVLAKAGSLCGTVLIVWQFVLGYRALAGKVMVDLIWVVNLHKAIGKYILFLIILHPVFITVYYIIKEGGNPLALEKGPRFDMYVVPGMIALLLFIFVVITSMWVRRRLTYQAWYGMHLSTYLALPLVFIHSIPIGQTLQGTGLGVLWLILLGLVVGMYFYRIACRLGVVGMGVRKHAVVRIEEVGQDVTEITARPQKRRVEPEIGQFVYLRRGFTGVARPFTVSKYDAQTGDLAMTVKAQGMGTTDMQFARQGEVVFIDGPYGVFLRRALRSRRPLVLVAGGIGITPFRRLFQGRGGESDEPVWLFYGNRYTSEIVYKDELESLQHLRVVHVISDEKNYPGETGFITPDLLKKYLPRDLREYEFLICGPPAMTTKLEAGLDEEGVPTEQIHHELFSY